MVAHATAVFADGSIAASLGILALSHLLRIRTGLHFGNATTPLLATFLFVNARADRVPHGYIMPSTAK